MYFPLSSRITVPWGPFASEDSWVPYSSGSFQAILAYIKWFVCVKELPEFLCKATESPGYRKAKVGSLAQRDTESLINPGPPHALRCSILHQIGHQRKSCLKKQTCDLPAAGNQKESCQPRDQCLISISVYHDTRTWMGSFIYSFVHLLKHSWTIYWGKCVEWRVIKGDKGPTLKEIKNLIMRQINSSNTLLFQVWYTDQKQHLESY